MTGKKVAENNLNIVCKDCGNTTTFSRPFDETHVELINGSGFEPAGGILIALNLILKLKWHFSLVMECTHIHTRASP